MFVGKEEERLVAAIEDLGEVDRPANASARIPLAHDGPLGRRRGKSAGVKNLIAVEIEHTAMNLVGSRLGDPIDNAVRSAAVLSGVGRTLDFELLHTLNAHAVHSGVVAPLAVGFGPVQLFALAVQQPAADTRVTASANHSRREN